MNYQPKLILALALVIALAAGGAHAQSSTAKPVAATPAAQAAVSQEAAAPTSCSDPSLTQANPEKGTKQAAAPAASSGKCEAGVEATESAPAAKPAPAAKANPVHESDGKQGNNPLYEEKKN